MTKDVAYDAVILQLDHPNDHSKKAIRTFIELLIDIPLIAWGVSEDEDTAVDILSQGAQDYIVKETSDGKTVIRSIRYAIERKRMERHLHALVHYDNLTQLPNRELLLDRLTQCIAQATRQQT